MREGSRWVDSAQLWDYASEVRLVRLLALFVAVLWSTESFAATPPQCGPDCRNVGRYVLCNDSLDASSVGSGAVQLNSFEWSCAAFGAPSASSFSLDGAWAGYAPTNGSFPTFIEVRVYGNGVGGGAIPMNQAMPSQSGNLSIPYNTTPAFVSLGLAPTYPSLSGSFRICLLNGADDSDMGIVYDGDGIQAGYNYQHLGGRPWEDAMTGGLTGDFSIRAVVTTTDHTPWTSPAGACYPVGADAGPRDSGSADAGLAPDAQDPADLGVTADSGVVPPADSGVGPADSGVPPSDSGVEPADAGLAPTDARSTDADFQTSDAQPADAGFAAADAQPADSGASPGDAGVAAPAPTISSISPDSGVNNAAIDVVVSGTGFVSGATLKIGAIPTTRVTVPGPTTLLAQVPPGIVAGTYDVVLMNPDGQAAVLVRGYEVTTTSGQAPTDGGCNCSSEPRGPMGLALLALALVRRRARRSSLARPKS